MVITITQGYYASRKTGTAGIWIYDVQTADPETDHMQPPRYDPWPGLENSVVKKLGFLGFF